jgi:hypothetical protein
MPREVPAALLLYLSSPSVCLALFLSGGMKGVYIGARRREQTGWTFQVAHQRYPFGQKKKVKSWFTVYGRWACRVC